MQEKGVFLDARIPGPSGFNTLSTIFLIKSEEMPEKDDFYVLLWTFRHFLGFRALGIPILAGKAGKDDFLAFPAFPHLSCKFTPAWIPTLARNARK